MKQQRNPIVGDEVIVTRCEGRPALAGECAVIVGTQDDGASFRLKTADAEWESPRADFILRERRGKSGDSL